MTESCRVKKVRRGIIYVELNKSQKCDGCKMCAFGKNNTIVMPALCDLPVQVGQTVTVRMPIQSAGNAALLIYAVPLLTMLIGALIGLVGEWQLQLGLAAAGLVVGLAAIIPIERLYRKKSGALPVVIADISEPACAQDADAGERQTNENTDNGEQYGT